MIMEEDPGIWRSRAKEWDMGGSKVVILKDPDPQ